MLSLLGGIFATRGSPVDRDKRLDSNIQFPEIDTAGL
jgi:hypothetical protein